MPTDKQIAANRRNARKSTGPRTAGGKRRSRLNAFRHGLTGQLDVMTGEMKEARDAFVARIVRGLKPADDLENQLAHSIAESYWRLNRVAVIENALFTEGDYVNHPQNEDVGYSGLQIALSASMAFVEHPERFNLLTVYEMRLQRKAQSELKQLRELQSARRAAERETVPQPAAQPAESKPAVNANGFVFSSAPAPAEMPPVPPPVLVNRAVRVPTEVPAHRPGGTAFHSVT